MKFMKVVTGVGSRKVDEEGAKRVLEIAELLDKARYMLRSGGADGCDTLFESRMGIKDIFLPWKNFNHHPSPYYQISEKAYAYAKTIHPYWDKLRDPVQKLNARNTYQVLGYELNEPSDILVCWTPDGCNCEKTATVQTGGTRTAIVLADRNHIPIYNLKNDSDYFAIKEKLIKELEEEYGNAAKSI